jgi:hypothetical protein
MWTSSWRSSAVMALSSRGLLFVAKSFGAAARDEADALEPVAFAAAVAVDVLLQAAAACPPGRPRRQQRPRPTELVVAFGERPGDGHQKPRQASTRGGDDFNADPQQRAAFSSCSLTATTWKPLNPTSRSQRSL